MKIAIVGAGISGLSAAYDLLQAGHEVTLFEAAAQTGGLASGFKDAAWDWPLEKFYHHIFESDKAIRALVESLGIEDKLFFPRPTTSIIYKDKIVPFDSPMRWITFPGFSWLDVARYGFVSAYLRFSKPWRKLEQHTADSWLRKFYGQKIYEMIWKPILIGKFGSYYKDVNMAWMWARLHVRSMRLGYFEGGFQAFIDRLAEAVQELGGEIRLNCGVQEIKVAANGRFHIQTQTQTSAQQMDYDQVLVTSSPGVFGKIMPDLPPDYLGKLTNLKSMGAVVLTLALKRPLLTQHKTYWLNIPAHSPDKSQNNIPFLALVEHTNYIDRKHYGGDHILYCGDYVDQNHPYLSQPKEEIETQFVAALSQINPDFNPDWVRKSWLFREKYAQPVPLLGHSANIPALATPIPGLFFASMSQVYPWDRGTNFAVEIGRRVAKQMQPSE